MSNLTIKYEDVCLYTQSGQPESVEFRKWLDSINASYAILDYSPDAVEEAIRPLNTWNFADIDGPASFSDMPLLVFHDVLWESPAGDDRYFHVKHAVSIEATPDDFEKKVLKGA
jgi:hypothetical protein